MGIDSPEDALDQRACDDRSSLQAFTHAFPSQSGFNTLSRPRPPFNAEQLRKETMN